MTQPKTKARATSTRTRKRPAATPPAAAPPKSVTSEETPAAEAVAAAWHFIAPPTVELTAEPWPSRAMLPLVAVVGGLAGLLLGVLLPWAWSAAVQPTPFGHVAAEVESLAVRVETPSRGRDCRTIALAIEDVTRRIDAGEFATLEMVFAATRSATTAAVTPAEHDAWRSWSDGVSVILDRCHAAGSLLTPAQAAGAFREVVAGLRRAAERG